MSSGDTEEPLTPSHLVTGRRVLSMPDDIAVAEEEVSEIKLLTRRQRYIASLMRHFWNPWKREYLVELREHHRAKRGTSNDSPSIQPGDIVTVMEGGLTAPLGNWDALRMFTGETMAS